MASFTFNEIHQQPAMWRKELQALLKNKAEISAFMHKYLTHDTDVVLTGAGTSAFIGDALQPVMRGLWRNVRSVPTTDIVTHAKYLLDAERPLLLVSFARSGNSPESVAAVNLANKLCKNVAHVYITCNKNGKLAQQAAGRENVLSLLLPEDTDDKSLAMTSSFSTMLLTCLMLGRIDTLEQDQEMIEKAAKNAEAVIADYEDKLKEIASRPFERGVFLGSGALKGSRRVPPETPRVDRRRGSLQVRLVPRIPSRSESCGEQQVDSRLSDDRTGRCSALRARPG